MPGLSEYLTDKGITTEKMPSWFTTAQQDLVSDVGKTVTPNIADTTFKYATDVFGDKGAYTSAQSALESIASGAANPWITGTDASGNPTISPNMQTALGGLFGAQQQYLNQILPDIEAAEGAKSIGSGGFGSRMNLSGVQRAKGQAAADLFQKQMAAALQNQQLGVQAATGLGNLGTQIGKGALETATFEQAYPYANLINEANIYGKLGPTIPKTTETSKQLSVLGQLGGLSSLLSNAPKGLSGITKGLGGLFDWAQGQFGSSGPTMPTYGGGAADPNTPGDWVY